MNSLLSFNFNLACMYYIHYLKWWLSLIYVGIGVVEAESGGDGVTLELEMQWDGNPKIVFDIETKLGVVLPVKVTYFCIIYYSSIINQSTSCKMKHTVVSLFIYAGRKYWIHWSFQIDLQATSQ